MQNSLQEFTIGFFDSSGVFSIYAKQYDTERLLKFHLDDEGQEYSELLASENLYALVREELPSGTPIPDIEIPSEYIDAEDSSITVPITADMVQEAGTAVCDLVFIEMVNGTEPHVLSTTRFKLIIAAAPTAPTSGREKEWFDNWTELYISLKTLETHIETEEAIRQENEETRIANENTRVSNENTRIDAENVRIISEETRVSNEIVRDSHEETRVNNETERLANEAARVTNEEARQSAEDARDEAEQAREAAEAIRESRVQEQVDEAHMWADGMTDHDDHPSATHNAKYYCDHARAVSGLFNGYKADWEAMSLEEKANYETVIFIDY